MDIGVELHWQGWRLEACILRARERGTLHEYEAVGMHRLGYCSAAHETGVWLAVWSGKVTACVWAMSF